MNDIPSRKYKVLHDHQIFSTQKFGGISRYFHELTKNKKNSTISVIYSDNHYFSKPFFKKFNIKNKYFRYILAKVNKLYSICKIIFSNYDIFHPTYYDPYFLKYLRKPFVITIYDMIHEKFPEYFKDSKRLIENKKKLAFKASRIIAISESTKKDIIEIYGIESGKIDVIYLASSFSLSAKKPKIRTLDFPYILFVGKRGLYKNFKNYIFAFSKVSKVHEDFKTICIGGGNFTDEEIDMFKKLEILDKVTQISASEEELWDYYSNSKMFVFPSEYEGFGLPILEAFSAKTPCLLSNKSSFPEVAKKAALYFDPKNQDEIIKRILQIIESESLKKQLIEKGESRLNFFSWTKTISATENVYKAVLSMGSPN